MVKKIRLGLVACAGLLGLVIATPALAAQSSKLGVSQTPSSGVVIHYSQAPADPAPAKISIYADPFFNPPAGQVVLNQASGTKIGTVSAQAKAGSLGGATLPLAGNIVAHAAADTYLSNGTPVPFTTASQVCTGTTFHTAYWSLDLTAAGQTLQVPVFVDAITPTGFLSTGLPSGPPEANYTNGWGSAEIKVCLPSPYVPPPSGAAFGASLFDANLAIKGVFFTSTGERKWRQIVVPYSAGTANADPSGIVETIGLMRKLGVASGRYKRHGNTVSVAGTVTEAGVAVEGATVTITGGTKTVKATTNDTGDYTATVNVKPASKVNLHGMAVVAERDLGGPCVEGAAAAAAFFASQGASNCTDSSVGGWTFAFKVKR